MPAYETYRAVGRRTVEGWVDPRTFGVLRVLSEEQQRLGVSGPVAEIGVHHGKLFIALQLLADPGVPAVAVDVFGDQTFNIDQSGRGDLRRFEKQVRRWGDWSAVVVEQADSTMLTGLDIMRLADGEIRLFSVDGGHTEETVLADMRTAEGALARGGIVIADDVFNEEWPGVSVGTMRYLGTGGRLVPFAIGFGKTYFTDEAHVAPYREVVRQDYGRRWRTAHKTTVFHGFDVEVLWGTPLTPRSVLRRSRVARQVYNRLASR